MEKVSTSLGVTSLGKYDADIQCAKANHPNILNNYPRCLQMTAETEKN